MVYSISTNSSKGVAAKQMSALNTMSMVDFESWMPPRKRAKTEEEKEIRNLQRVLRNRRSSRQSRNKKRRYVAMLEKHCSVMRRVIEDLRYKLNIGSLISDKENWKAYLQLQQHHFLSSSPSDTVISTSNRNSDSTSRLVTRESINSTIGEENKMFTESSLGANLQIRTQLDSSEFQSKIVRDVEKITASDNDNSVHSINSLDCESDIFNNTIHELTPVSLASSLSEKFNIYSIQEELDSYTPLSRFFFPSECQSTNLDFDNKFYTLDAFEDTNINEESLKNKGQNDHNALYKGLY
ncbi:Transcriptional activator HAC1 [Nakaseomyces bracarensis]|uniref:Transcriptional activator HAC1 n=1 Tax=Nakaseomyces bracarensis TaxID=273131 RepID=A0ABR4NM55_9SACH